MARLEPRDLDLCVASAENFHTRSPDILSNITKANEDFWNTFFKRMLSIVATKQFEPFHRFYALYLLFKVAEKGNPQFGSSLAKELELLTFLYHTAMHDSNKKMAFDERGKFFFSKSPSKVECKIGINFVRLSLEFLVNLKKIYGRQDTNHPYFVFTDFYNNLQANLKIPAYLIFIDRHYDLSQNLATWDYHNALPKKIGELLNENLKKKVKLLRNIINANKAQGQNSKSLKKLFSNSKSVKLSDNKTSEQVLQKDLELKKEKSAHEAPRIIVTATEDSRMTPIEESYHNPETARDVSLEGLEMDPSSGQTKEQTKESFSPLSRGEFNLTNFSTFSSSGAARPKNYKERISLELLEIQNSIEKSRLVNSASAAKRKSFEFNHTYKPPMFNRILHKEDHLSKMTNGDFTLHRTTQSAIPQKDGPIIVSLNCQNPQTVVKVKNLVAWPNENPKEKLMKESARERAKSSSQVPESITHKFQVKHSGSLETKPRKIVRFGLFNPEPLVM